MASGLVDKVKFTGARISAGAVTDWVRVAPYRLPTDIKSVNDRIFLEVKLAGDDTIYEHAWYEIGAGNQLTIYRVVDTYLRSGDYTTTPPSAVNDFDGPVEVGGIANSQTIPVIGPDGSFLNGAAVNSSLIAPDIKTLQARNDLQNGQKFFAADNLHVNGGADAGGGSGLMVRYDSGSGVAPDYSWTFPLTSGLGGRLIGVPLKVPQKLGPFTIPAGGETQVVNANRAGGLWLIEAWSDDDALSYCEAKIVGHASDAEIRGAIEIGDLSVERSGTSIRIKNNGLTEAQFSATREERH